jgi:hypothetical protein
MNDETILFNGVQSNIVRFDKNIVQEDEQSQASRPLEAHIRHGRRRCAQSTSRSGIAAIGLFGSGGSGCWCHGVKCARVYTVYARDLLFSVSCWSIRLGAAADAIFGFSFGTRSPLSFENDRE